MTDTSINLKHHWQIEPNLCFLNHGSFGATPRTILNYQHQLRTELEKNPIEFLARKLEQKLDIAREKLAQFIGGEPENLVFVPNATFGVNTVLRSLPFAPEDEILVTNHTYNACRNAVNFVTSGAKVGLKVVSIPFPIDSPQQVINAILDGVSPRTRLALIDHITSPTALVFPIEKIVKELLKRGIDTIVDGAHAPGFLPINLKNIETAYYTGNCHKWLCAPKGAAFLYVKPDRQKQIRPLVISHGMNSPRTDRSRFLLEFDWMGTDDPTPYLCIPQAIEWLDGLFTGGITQLYQRNHLLVIEARKLICNTLNISPPCPEEMLGLMATINLGKIPQSAEELQRKLLEEFAIEVPVIPWSDEQTLIRISAQAYNNIEDYEYFAKCLQKLL
ncbi:aminotransferase [Aphanothece hegewaldii CCALA 016]|uniref:Aminotransferase n=1 Tax=Aphanothece hegewaldii CCALA 016 TaxID=2107694 RepID=A0A2T1M3W3_9CHRO|nr:aminotransferase class V-fold PLP-dependent enzyme [Aphanothece hegewaldii]PSF39533.1 aminotransferase [Aphanothece hegewaldii CCALA 016]